MPSSCRRFPAWQRFVPRDLSSVNQVRDKISGEVAGRFQKRYSFAEILQGTKVVDCA